MGVNSSCLKVQLVHIRPAIMPWNRLPPPPEAKKKAFFSRPKVSWALVEQPSTETSSAASDVPTSKTKIQVLPVDGSFQKKSEYQLQQEELMQEMAKEVAASLNSRQLRVAECVS